MSLEDVFIKGEKSLWGSLKKGFMESPLSIPVKAATNLYKYAT